MTTGKAERRQQLARFEKQATRIAVGLVIAGPVLGIGAGMLGAAEIYPSEYATPVAIATMLVLIGAALLIGAMGGLYLMGGWKATPFGLLFVAGFAALVYGIAEAGPWWRVAGVGMLAVSCGAFFVTGMGSDRTPASAGRIRGSAGALAAGAVAAVIGFLIDSWGVLLFGGMAAGTGAGILIGSRSAARP